MTTGGQPRCPQCKRFLAGPGQRHVCAGELDRCANLRCRRLLPLFPRSRSGYCIRCEVMMALGQAGHGSSQPVNTGRPRRWRAPVLTSQPAEPVIIRRAEEPPGLAEVRPRRIRPAWRERLDAHRERISRRLWGEP